MERASELDPRNLFLATNVAGFYFGSRPLPYERTRKALDRVLALKPNYIDARIDRGGGLEMHWRGDTRHWHATIDKILADEPASANEQGMKAQRFELALFERDFITARRAVADLPQEGLDGLSRDFWKGVVARAKGDAVAAQAAFTAARAQQEAAVRAARRASPTMRRRSPSWGSSMLDWDEKKRRCAKAGRQSNSCRSQKTRRTVRRLPSTWR